MKSKKMVTKPVKNKTQQQDTIPLHQMTEREKRKGYQALED